MSLPENPSGRELAAFADELRAATTVIYSLPASQNKASTHSQLRTAAGWLDYLVNDVLAREAREAIKAEAEQAAADAERWGHAEQLVASGTEPSFAPLKTCCDPGATGEVAEHGFVAAEIRTVETALNCSPPSIVINVNGVTNPDAVALAVSESLERQARLRKR